MNATFRSLALGLIVALGSAESAAAAISVATPMPGGAYDINGVSGSMSQVLFNGKLRLRGMTLKDAGPNDAVRPVGANGRAIVFRAIVSNGTLRETHGFFNATLADADGITIGGRPLDDGWSLEPGTAARAVYGFQVPGDFVPVRLVLIEATDAKPKAFRIKIAPADLSAGPLPVASP